MNMTEVDRRLGSVDDRTQVWAMEDYEHLDPVTFQVIGKALVAICREMGITMVRTAYSPIFVDGLDFSCGLLDAQSEMVAQGDYCPVHLNSMSYTSRWAIIEKGVENISDGDVLIHNDPYRGGTHLNDINVMKPVFHEGRLLAITCNRAHHIDVGGKARGGFAGDATEIFQEGIRVPPIKWFDAGVEREDVLDLYTANVRQPDVVLGDLAAQLASCITGERRILALCERYGGEAVRECFVALKEYSERRMRAALQAMPDGERDFGIYMDHDGIVDEPVRIHVGLSLAGDNLTVDLSDSNREVAGPINATYGITASMVFNALLQVADPTIPVNQGCFRPVEIVAPRGSIVNAEFPAPTMGGNTVTSMAIYQAMLGALTMFVPDRGAASSYSSHHFTGGGDDWLFYLFTDGGWGATAEHDGWSGVFQANGNCRDYPVEVMEMTLPLRYDEVRLLGELAGPGKFRGGAGTLRRVTLLKPAEVNSIAEGGEFAPFGVFGGAEAGGNALIVHRGDQQGGFKEMLNAKFDLKFANRRLQAGDSVSVITGGGGGYGNPHERDPSRVLSDVSEDLLTVQDAEALYGVVLIEDGGNLVVDAEATKRRRAQAGKMSQPAAPSRTGGAAGMSEAGRRAAARVKDLSARVPHEYCRNTCELRASPDRCPLHDAEALGYWNVTNLERWIGRRCPKADVILDTGMAPGHADAMHSGNLERETER